MYLFIFLFISYPYSLWNLPKISQHDQLILNVFVQSLYLKLLYFSICCLPVEKYVWKFHYWNNTKVNSANVF